MVDHATAKYLQDNLGGVLAKALAEMSIAQPTDGVDFLSRWLKTYAEQEEAKEAREEEKRLLEEKRSQRQVELKEKEARQKELGKVREQGTSPLQDHLAKLSAPEGSFPEHGWRELLQVAQSHAGAQAAYLGLLEEEGIEGQEGKCLCYTHCSSGQEWMLEKVLPENVGVSWGALAEPTEETPYLWRPPKPAAEEAEEAEDPDAEPPAEEEGPTPFLPVAVECVTDAPEVHYFDMTRLGAYVAVPLLYTSYYTPEALADATQFEEERKAAEKAAEEAAAAAAEAAESAAAAGEDGEEAAEGEEEKEAGEAPKEKVLVLRGSPVRLLLCLDTLGANSPINEASIPELMELCKLTAQCRERTETKQVMAQALAIMEEQRLQASEEDDSKKDLVAKCRADVEAELKEARVQEEQEAEDEQKELVKEKYKYLKEQKAFLRLKDLMQGLADWVVFPPEALSVLAALAFMYGFTKEQVYPKRKASLRWPPLRALLMGTELWSAVEGADLCAARKGLSQEQKLASIKELASPADFDAEKAAQFAPALELAQGLIQAAVAYRSKHLEVLKAEYAKRKEAAGEEEPFTEPAPEDLDDDCVEG